MIARHYGYTEAYSKCRPDAASSGHPRLHIEILARDRGGAVGRQVVLLEEPSEFVAQSARALGISSRTLSRKLKTYRLESTANGFVV